MWNFAEIFLVGCVALLCIYKVVDRLIRIARLGSLTDRYVFITGCDSGFGNLLAKRLDSKGCHVIAACLTEQGGTELRNGCSSRLKIVTMDVTSHDSVVKAYDHVKSILPPGRGEDNAVVAVVVVVD